MDPSTEQVIVATQNQLLKLWFLLFQARGYPVERAAQQAWRHTELYLREAGFSDDQVRNFMLSEYDWTQMMLGLPDDHDRDL